MQTAKIAIGEEYAKPRKRYGEPEQLQRFKVKAIVTRKEKGTSYSKIEGWVVEDQPIGEDGQRKFDTDKITSCSPEDLIGPFQEHKELFDRRMAEIAAREAVEKAHENACAELFDLLYEKTGTQKPDGVSFNDFNIPFRNSRARVEIGRQGVVPLLEALKRL